MTQQLFTLPLVNQHTRNKVQLVATTIMGGGSSKSPSSPSSTKSSPMPPPKTWHHILSFDPTYTIEFPPNTGSLGIGLMSPVKSDQRVYVKVIVPNSLAANQSVNSTQEIRTGDMLVKLNDIDVSLFTIEASIEYLRCLPTDAPRILGFYSGSELETYEVTMQRGKDAGGLGATIINSRYGQAHIATVISFVREGSQAAEAGILPGDSILKIGRENIHSGGRASEIIRHGISGSDSSDDSTGPLVLQLCRGMRTGARGRGTRMRLSTETDYAYFAHCNDDKEENVMDFTLSSSYIDPDDELIEDLQQQQEEADAKLRKDTSKKKRQMTGRIQERLYARTILKNSPESLKQTYLFEGLEDEIIAKIVDGMQFKTISTGQHLMTQGEFASDMMVLLKGEATVLFDNVELKKCAVFDCLGEGSLVTGDHVRGATVRADSKLDVLVLTRDRFQHLLDEHVLPTSVVERAQQVSKRYEKSDAERLLSLMDGRTKYIVKYQQGSMGLQLACLSVKDKRVFVKSIVKDGQSDLTAKVSPGHQLLAVGEEDVTVGMSLNDILALIAKKKRPLSIMFAADDVAGVGAAISASQSLEWVSCAMTDGEDDQNLTFAEVRANNVDIVQRIQQEQAENEKKQAEKRQQQQKAMADRVQQRLKARTDLKHSKCLANCSLFNGFDSDVLSSIIDVMEYRKYSEGKNLVTQGDMHACEMMIITKGSCKVTVDEKEVRTLKTLDCIGEQSLLSADVQIRSATVTAIGGVQVLVLSRLKWERLHKSGIIQQELTDGYVRNARNVSTKYSKADATRLAKMVSSGEVIDEGVTDLV